MTDTVRLTTAQALVRFLAPQHRECDGVEQRLVTGMLGIFGHRNVAQRRAFAAATGIPFADTHAGKGAINQEVSTLGSTQRAYAEHVTAKRDYL